MTEDQELLFKISQLAGKINRHKNQQTQGWITKQDRHRQLISPAIYEKEMLARAQDLEKTRQLKVLQKDEREQAKLQKHLRTYPGKVITAASAVNSTGPRNLAHEVVIQGVPFRVANGGSPSSARSTPKTAKVGGVMFVRSKNGNLYRSGVPTPERVPACMHFIRGNCSNETCRYAHVRVNPGGPVCRPFATLGYCEKGSQCTERHVFECPDYANLGACNKRKCRLPHVDRAGQIRKMAAHAAAGAVAETPAGASMADDNASGISSDGEEIDSDDFDSDGVAEDLSRLPDLVDDSVISTQQDFVHF
ncbi:MAG: hypothetical protein M1826_006860 [Phylliscum demangeonii]|nr:MAG: hypothetical protein M1826_006860 [Phylliscum demangeonii]